MKASVALLSLVIVGFTLISSAQDNQESKPGLEGTWERYQTSTIQEIIESQKEVLSDSGWALTAAEFALRTPVVYHDSLRPMTSNHKQLLEFWCNMRDAPDSYRDAFESEVLISENGKMYWFPVQTTLAEAMKQNCVRNDTIEIYTQWLGAIPSGEEIDWLFVINEFIEAR